jgi:hypothetical protein
MPQKPKKYKLELLNLKEFITKKGKEIKKPLKLICFNECKECRIFINNNSTDTIVDIELSEELEVYRRNIYDEIKLIEYPNIKIEDREYNVCLEFELFSNGSSSNFIVKNIDKYYSYGSYFKETKVFKEIEDASDYLYNKELFPTTKDDVQ